MFPTITHLRDSLCPQSQLPHSLRALDMSPRWPRTCCSAPRLPASACLNPTCPTGQASAPFLSVLHLWKQNLFVKAFSVHSIQPGQYFLSSYYAQCMVKQVGVGCRRDNHELDMVSALKELTGTPRSNPNRDPSLIYRENPRIWPNNSAKNLHTCPSPSSLSIKILLFDKALRSGGRDTWSAK